MGTPSRGAKWIQLVVYVRALHRLTYPKIQLKRVNSYPITERKHIELSVYKINNSTISNEADFDVSNITKSV